MIVGLDLEADRMVIVEGNHAGVIDEHGQAPVDAVGDQGIRGRDDGGFQEIMDDD